MIDSCCNSNDGQVNGNVDGGGYNDEDDGNKDWVLWGEVNL
jgi:hypothetical protein